MRPERASVSRRTFDNGATVTSLPLTRPKAHSVENSPELVSGNLGRIVHPTSLFWTADHVVIASESFTSKGAYVACSRGRKSCIVHTPDKARLTERLPEGNRRAALDALLETHSARASIVNRVRAWKQLSVDLTRRLAAQAIQPSAAQMRIARPQEHLTQSL